MNQISKTSKNFANRRKLDITEESWWNSVPNVKPEIKVNGLWVWKESNEIDPILTLIANKFGGWSFNTHLLPDSITEELPAYIRDEKHLREVLDFIYKELGKGE